MAEKKEQKKKENKQLEEIKELLKKNEELEEKLLRNQAELVNFKRRKEEELVNYIKYANVDLFKELLPILDDFERAVSMDDDNPDDEVSKFLEGFKMIYNRVKTLLKDFPVS